MAGAGPVLGSLDVALAHATRLLAAQPALAAEQAGEILRAVPGEPQARLILGQAKRALGDLTGALGALEPLAAEQRQSARVQFELARTLSLAGRAAEAVARLREATRLQPRWPDAWRELADHLDAAGDAAGADRARAAFLGAAVHDPALRAAASALQGNELDQAEAMLRSHLKAHPSDVAALRMLAEVAARLRRFHDAQLLLEDCLERAPSFAPALHQYAVVLFRQGKAALARPHVEKLLAAEPQNLGYLTLLAAILAFLGDYADATRLYEAVLGRRPNQSRIWLSYGHALKTAGRSSECVAAYRRSIELEPGLGEGYWSLANLKTYRFAEADVTRMERALDDPALADADRLHFHYALGKAHEDAGAYEASFVQYERGARIRRALQPYDANETQRYVQRCRTLYTQALFAARAQGGVTASDPIFIVGMPRSGSTLVEQILASHPLVEGTMELPNLPTLARELGRSDRTDEECYPESVGKLSDEELGALGRRYLAETRAHRRKGTPHFLDKMPNNFLHAGLIQLILPRSRIIDTRRHPLACCFSNFKQHFALGQNFSYSLEDVGRYYRSYVELMAHFDAVLPGRMHRVVYEELVADPEAEVRRLLDYCGLPFDERCLRFYENDRAVRTASAEQVRQPIFQSGVDHWRHFDPWLGPLRAVLGPVLEQYPDVPDEFLEAPPDPSGPR